MTLKLESHAATMINKKGGTNEDRYLVPLGELLQRRENAGTPELELKIQAKIDAIQARGLVFAVLDGVAGAPMGMRAAQRGADLLRELYRRPELAPRAGYPSAAEVLKLLYEANEDVASWGEMDQATDGNSVGAGVTGRPQGAACVTAAYASPAGHVTLLQAGDTAAFVYRPRSGDIALYTSPADVAGRAVRKYLGLGPALHIDTFALTGLEPGDLIALVTDGVFPKGFANRDGIRKVLVEADGDPRTAARELVQRSRAHGSNDDITAVVLAVG